MERWGPKDPRDLADYWFIWKGVLATGVTITSHELEIPTPLVVDQDEHLADEVRVRLGGGVDDTAYDCVCKIVTSTGEIFYATQVLAVKERRQPPA